MTDLAALGVQTPQINTMANFNQSQSNAIAQKSEIEQQHEKAIEAGGQLAFGLLDGNPDGTVTDQARVQQAVTMLGGPNSEAAKQLLADPTAWARQMAHTARSWYALSNEQKQGLLADYQIKAADPNSADNKLKRELTQSQIDVNRAKPGITPTDDQKELSQINEERATKGLEPIGMQDYIASKGGNGLSVTLPDGTTIGQGGAKGVNAYDTAEGKGLYETGQTMAKEGRAGTAQLGTLSKMKELLSEDSVYTGAGADQVAGLKRAAVSLGFAEPDSVKDTETFTALAKKSVLDLAGGSLGTGFSNGDRDYLDAQVPSIQNTKPGNIELISVMEKVAQRKIDIAKFAADYKKAHSGKLDWQFDGALADWAEAHPLFDGKPATGADDPSKMSDADLLKGLGLN